MMAMAVDDIKDVSQRMDGRIHYYNGNGIVDDAKAAM